MPSPAPRSHADTLTDDAAALRIRRLANACRRAGTRDTMHLCDGNWEHVTVSRVCWLNGAIVLIKRIAPEAIQRDLGKLIRVTIGNELVSRGSA